MFRKVRNTAVRKLNRGQTRKDGGGGKGKKTDTLLSLSLAPSSIVFLYDLGSAFVRLV